MRTLSVLTTIAICLLLLFKSYTEAQSVINKPEPLSMDVVGGLEPYKSTEVSTAETGVVIEVLVKRGEKVEAGQPLSRLDDRQQKVTLRQAEADYIAAGQLKTYSLEKEFNQRRAEKTKELVDGGKGSPRELERYELELDIARAKLLAGEEAKEIAGIQAEKAKLLLEARTIVAPHDGVIEEIFRSEGEFVAANAPAIVRLVDSSKLRAIFMLPESVAEQIRGKETIEIRLPSNAVVSGAVEYIASIASLDGRTIAMTVLVDNPDGNIRSAHCELILP